MPQPLALPCPMVRPLSKLCSSLFRWGSHPIPSLPPEDWDDRITSMRSLKRYSYVGLPVRGHPCVTYISSFCPIIKMSYITEQGVIKQKRKSHLRAGVLSNGASSTTRFACLRCTCSQITRNREDTAPKTNLSHDNARCSIMGAEGGSSIVR